MSQNVRRKGFGSCQMDHRQSNWDQNVQNCQSASHEAGAGSLPAQGELLFLYLFTCHVKLLFHPDTGQHHSLIPMENCLL